MKIHLSAFGGKLRSRMEEWPEETPPWITLLLATESLNYSPSSDPVEQSPRWRVGRFE